MTFALVTGTKRTTSAGNIIRLAIRAVFPARTRTDAQRSEGDNLMMKVLFSAPPADLLF
jgi:hypothetical protein